MITTTEVRNQFIEFFRSKEHQFVRSSPVFPLDDPTLLFTNAGMNQFKSIFLEQEKPKFSRVTNSQKCIRASGKHNDLEEVGVDSYHHTFFEMLGNWSFGDFYKKEAIEWAWELLTEVWKLDKSKLWVTIYQDDDETGEIWKSVTDISSDRVLKFGKKDNFWEMGETGPCGPCTEIHYYTGENPKNQNPLGVNDLPEYREIWNLVFIQYNRKADGSLEDLPSKHVDTGAGLERITAILNGFESNYDTNIFQSIIKEVENISDKSYSYEQGVPHRVIADHLRMISFSIADGIMPSNEGRGYVVRRILRRALRFGRKLGLNKPFLHKLVNVLNDEMRDAFPEINDKLNHVKNVILSEEKSFNKTLGKGLDIFKKICFGLNNSNLISGKDAFKLYDTYGFPIDLTELLAREKNLLVDILSFNKYMEIQRKRARDAGKFSANVNECEWITFSENKKSIFVGYSDNNINCNITKYRKNENGFEIVLDETPFYAESGGQVGDKGLISNNNFRFNVVNTQKIGDDIIHFGQFSSGEINENLKVSAEYNKMLRQNIKLNHTATHLLHKSLKLNLGDHVQQAGSLVSPDKLRFDLTHFEQIPENIISDIESDINEEILKNIQLDITETSFDNAKNSGAEALFGEKYGDTVRVVNIPGYSKELCGGTHVKSTGDIGMFKIISESSLASGVRRIEAITGREAFNKAQENNKQLTEVSNLLNTADDSIIENIISLKQKIKLLEIENHSLKTQNHLALIDELLENIIIVNSSKFIFSSLNDILDLKEFGTKLFDRSGENTVILLGTINNSKPMVFCGVTAGSDPKIHAGNLVRDIGNVMGGGGGGKPHLATAGGKDKDKLNTALEFGKNKIMELLQ
jgi:alanyl-tRNA synthetase